MSQTCLVIGASHAATALVTGLRQEGWAGPIQVIGEEAWLPYHRPPLSKDLLAGKKTLEDILIRPEEVYRKADVQFMLGTRAEAIDRADKTILLDNGKQVKYDKLALTLGSRVRRVDLPGVELDGIFYLRDYNDVTRIKAHIKPGGNAVIVGGGYIGLEAAAVLRQLGMNVTVLEMMERVMQRVTAPEVSEFYTHVHTQEGVIIRCGVGANGFEGNDRVAQVQCTDGKAIDADLVIIGVGIVPNVELASAAGLGIDNGILVDEYCRTNDADIVAAGDCTNHFNILYQRRVRLESVQNANDQARTAAANLCGKDKVYDALPWFWSDQYDLKLQIAGLSAGYDELVVRGDRAGSRSFAAFYLKQGAVIAVDAVNKPVEFMAGKRLITEQVQVDKDKLADPAIHPKELINK